MRDSSPRPLNFKSFDQLMNIFFCCRLVMNLMTINTVSCLFLFPAIVVDMKSTYSDVISSNETSVDNSSSMTSSSTSSSSVGICIVSSFLSSIVAHGSILAMLSVGK